MPFRIRHFEFDFTPFLAVCFWDEKSKRHEQSETSATTRKQDVAEYKLHDEANEQNERNARSEAKDEHPRNSIVSPNKSAQSRTTVTNACTSRTTAKQYYGKDDAAINFLRRFATTTTTPKTTATRTMCKKCMFSTFLFLFFCIGPTAWQMFSIRFSHFCMSWLLSEIRSFLVFFCTNGRVHASVYCMCISGYAPVFLLKFHVYLIVWWIFAVYLPVWPAIRANKIKQRKYEIRIANTANARPTNWTANTLRSKAFALFSLFPKILFMRCYFTYSSLHYITAELTQLKHRTRLIEFISTYSFIYAKNSRK